MLSAGRARLRDTGSSRPPACPPGPIEPATGHATQSDTTRTIACQRTTTPGYLYRMVSPVARSKEGFDAANRPGDWGLDTDVPTLPDLLRTSSARTRDEHHLPGPDRV
jgi:hypothetical protein